MKKLFKKDQKGFTLAELLIVVAIIGVLVAVSIPIFSSKLEASREGTDVANMRAAKAAAAASYLSADLGAEWTVDTTTKVATAFYDADNGVLVKTNAASISYYGKGTNADGGTTYTNYSATTDYTKQIIQVQVATDTGAVTVTWVTRTTT